MIFALHGFLGLPTDWVHFDGALRSPDGNPLTWRKWNLYADLPRQPGPSDWPLRDWASGFCQRVNDGWKQFGDPKRHKPILLGYSMGGRLALHAAIARPDLFSCAVIIGAHPGLVAEDMRLQRRLNDARWAERFRAEEWTSLVRAWGEQDVFAVRERDEDMIPLRREEGDFDRTRLAHTMSTWSLAEQENLRPALADLRLPMLWLHGASDRRFRELYRELRMDLIDSPAHAFVEIPRAGHRVPWDNPHEFIEQVQEFLNHVLALR
ncbi:MAG: alpha/beta fold hydrolase [Bdellovibrionaceae bacterium]|nr:alpha/beta fold hydrolase [Pseudobdellovibrionaceae bacterium]